MSEGSDVLLVEDNLLDAELTIRALKKKNLTNHLVHVIDGQEALDYLFGNGKYASRNTTQRPRLMLLDLKLPKVDGIEVLRQVRANPATRTLPVVVLTSSAEQRDLLQSYHLGANSYIVKPVEFEKFAQAVSDLGLYWLLLNQPPPN